MRRLGLSVLFCLLPVLGHAQDKAQTLADIRNELGQLAAEFNALKAELVSTGAATSGAAGADALTRMDTIEAELARLTARTEEVELKLNRVVSDGTNRIGDIEYRLCEVTEGCDPAKLGATPQIGADAGAAAAPVATDAGAAPATDSTGGAELAVSEKADFDRAKEVLGQGDFPGAAALFATYAQSYPGGPLVPEALYLRGEALAKQGDVAGSAKAYLDSYSADPKGPKAPDAVLELGKALGQLGQVDAACTTLGSLPTTFPASAAAAQATGAMQGLGCL